MKPISDEDEVSESQSLKVSEETEAQ
jgi:hypothetical protein